VKRLHVHLHVDDIGNSVRFYTTLFAAEPAVLRADYAKWQLEDPRVNFAISTGASGPGLDHLGIEVESADELAAIAARGDAAGFDAFVEPDARCCYARSTKRWFTDPQAIKWETFHTVARIDTYGEDRTGTASGAPLCCP